MYTPQMVARILREAGARVRENFFLRDAGIVQIDPADGRHIVNKGAKRELWRAALHPYRGGRRP